MASGSRRTDSAGSSARVAGRAVAMPHKKAAKLAASKERVARGTAKSPPRDAMRLRATNAATMAVPVPRFATASRLGRPAAPLRAASHSAAPQATARIASRAVRSVRSSPSRGSSVRRHTSASNSGNPTSASHGHGPFLSAQCCEADIGDGCRWQHEGPKPRGHGRRLDHFCACRHFAGLGQLHEAPFGSAGRV